MAGTFTPRVIVAVHNDGTWEEKHELTRVPCVGEFIKFGTQISRVERVCHLPGNENVDATVSLVRVDTDQCSLRQVMTGPDVPVTIEPWKYSRRS